MKGFSESIQERIGGEILTKDNLKFFLRFPKERIREMGQ